MAHYSKPLDQLPRRHNAFFKKIADFSLRVSGWKLEGEIANVPKLLVTAAPHRTAWEFALGIAVLYSLGLDIRWMVKHTVFRWPFGYLAGWLGGIPIDRNAAHGVVQATVKQFEKSERLLLVIMAEGSRSNAGAPVAEWKRGYYFIGNAAGVPLMPIYIDHAGKRVVFGGAVSLADDREMVTTNLQAFFDREKATAQGLLVSSSTTLN